MESAQQQAQGAQDTPTLQKSSHVLPTTGEEEREADAQSELREHLEMIKLEVHPFLQPPFEDATFFPEALLRYIRRNKPYALSDDQENVLPKLGSYLNKTVQILSKASGAAIYAVALWDDGKQGTSIYDCCSDCVAGYITHSESMDVVRSFGVYVQEALGPTFVRKLEDTFPCVYGSEHMEFRPRLPPHRSELKQEQIFIDEYLEYLHRWQGLPDEIDWEAVHRDIHEGTFELVECNRLPANPPAFTHPLRWSDDEVVLFADFIREHQSRLDTGNESAEATAFQWWEPGRSDGFRTHMSKNATLVYPKESSLYFLPMQKFGFSTNHYLATTRKPLWTDRARSAIRRMSLDMPVIGEVLQLLERHNRLASTERPPCDDDPMLVQAVPAFKHDIEGWLEFYRFPADFRNWKHKDWNRWSLPGLHHWLDEGHIIDASTGRLHGGFSGAARVFLAAVKAWNVVKFDIDHPWVTHAPHEWRFTVNEQLILEDIFEYLKGRLTTDLNADKRAVKHSKPYWASKMTRTTPWQPREITYANMMGYKGPLDDPAMSMRDISMVSIAKRAHESTASKQGAPARRHSDKLSEPGRSREATMDAGFRAPGVLEAMELDTSGVSLGDMGEDDEVLNPPCSTKDRIVLNPYLPPETGGTQWVSLHKRVQLERKLATERPAQAPLPDIPEATPSRHSHSEPRNDPEPLSNVLQLRVEESQPGSPVLMPSVLDTPSFQSHPSSSTAHGRGRSLIRPKPAWQPLPENTESTEELPVGSEGQVSTPMASGQVLALEEATPKMSATEELSPSIPLPARRQTHSKSGQVHHPSQAPGSSA